MREATMRLSLDFGGGDTWEEILTLARFLEPSGANEILPGDELEKMTPVFSNATRIPRYYGSGTRTVDASNSLTWSLEIYTTHLWFDAPQDLAFFTLAVALDVSATINDHEYSFQARETEQSPDSEPGGISLLGQELALFGQLLDATYTFALDDFEATSWFPFEISPGVRPVIDAATGVELEDHRITGL
jgi:hypothetical protein